MIGMIGCGCSGFLVKRKFPVSTESIRVIRKIIRDTPLHSTKSFASPFRVFPTHSIAREQRSTIGNEYISFYPPSIELVSLISLYLSKNRIWTVL